MCQCLYTALPAGIEAGGTRAPPSLPLKAPDGSMPRLLACRWSRSFVPVCGLPLRRAHRGRRRPPSRRARRARALPRLRRSAQRLTRASPGCAASAAATTTSSPSDARPPWRAPCGRTSCVPIRSRRIGRARPAASARRATRSACCCTASGSRRSCSRRSRIASTCSPCRRPCAGTSAPTARCSGRSAGWSRGCCGGSTALRGPRARPRWFSTFRLSGIW